MSEDMSEAKKKFRRVVNAQRMASRLIKASQSESLMRRHSSIIIPGPGGLTSLANLEDLHPIKEDNNDGLMRRSSQKQIDSTAEEKTDKAGFWPAATVSVILGVMSVVPYNMVLASDRGSALFISFVTHVFFVTINAQQLRVLLSGKLKIPLIYHSAFVALGFIFNMLKSDAFSRLPTSMCMLLMNLQMLVGMTVQRVALGKHYSSSQLLGCGLVTAGVALAAAAKGQAQSGAATAAIPFSDILIGTSEMMGALLALTVLSLLVKAAFSQYGESIEEQLFMQHLFGLPLFFPQRSQILPRAVQWLSGGNWFLICLLLGNMALTFGDRRLSVQVVGRAPNLLIVQLLETLKKFASMILCSLLAAPPLPSLGFWGGAVLLGLGTLQYLNASDAPEKEKEDD